jgi:hypothetical protein
LVFKKKSKKFPKFSYLGLPLANKVWGVSKVGSMVMEPMVGGVVDRGVVDRGMVHRGMVSVTTMGTTADSDHLDIGFFNVVDLNSFGDSLFVFLNVFVDTDFLGNFCDRLCADSTGDLVALLNINNDLDGQFNIVTDLKNKNK